MSMMKISEIAELVRDSEHNIQEFIREDRIPYIICPDGILILFHGFQQCMDDLYDLSGAIERLFPKEEE